MRPKNTANNKMMYDIIITFMYIIHFILYNERIKLRGQVRSINVLRQVVIISLWTNLYQISGSDHLLTA